MMSLRSIPLQASVRRIAPALAAIILAGAAASTAQAQQQEDRCVQIGNINGYTVIDDRHLVLHSGANRYFLITTATRCSGMRFGVQIGTSIRDHQRVCPPYTDYIVPDDGWRCRIASIEAVEDPDAARALLEERRAADQ